MFDVGQAAVTSLIKEPVKEAVKEALVEERVAGDEGTEKTRRSVPEESSSTGSRLPGRRLLVPLAGVGALAIYAKRRGLSLRDLRDLGGVGDMDEYGSTRITDESGRRHHESSTHSTSRSTTGGVSTDDEEKQDETDREERSRT